MKTIGERIRYFRKDRQLTQDKLAELTDIHPVSIRKYETKKMQPQIEQIERIASVLNENVLAIVGYNSKPSIVRTVGDLTGALMTLFKSHVLMIIGKPSFSDEEACMGDFEPMKGMDSQKMLSMVNPMLSSFFDVGKITDGKGNFSTGRLSLKQLDLIMKSKECAEDFIRWAATHTLYESLLSSRQENEAPDDRIEFIATALEEQELILLSNTEPLPRESFDDDSEPLFLRFPE